MARSSPVERLESRRLFAADLVSVVPSIDSPAVGPALNAIGRFVVQNGGDIGTGQAIQYQLVFAHESDLSDATVLQTLTTPALDAGGSRVVEFDIPIDASHVGDSFLFGLRLDPTNQIAELNDSNNDTVSVISYAVLPTQTSDSVSGDTGDDTFSVSQYGDVLVIQTGVSTGTIADLTVRGTMTFDLGDGNDSLNATIDGVGGITEPIVVHGGNGSDTIIGGNGNDTLTGDAGSDRIAGGSGDDSVAGGDGKDFLNGGAGSDYVLGSGQSDHLTGGAGRDTLSGGGGRDFLDGNTGADYLLGGAGNDLLFGVNTADFFLIDTLSGNSGNDYAAADDNDVITSIEDLA